MMMFSDLMGLLQSGAKPVVTLKKGYEESEGCYSAGMRVRVIACRSRQDGLGVITFDAREFDEINDPLMTRDFINRETGNYDRTAKEAGCWRDIDELYVDLDANIGHILELVPDDSSRLYGEFKESGSELNYIRWLESVVLALRA